MRKISVCMAVKNEEKYVNQAIVSILEQTNCNLEIIIVDDNSTDGTIDIIKNTIKNNFNAKLIKNKGKGKVSAFNLAVSKSTGDYICLFAGDDIMPKNSLAKRYEEVKNYSPTNNIAHLCKLQILSNNSISNGQVIPRAKGKGTTSGATIMLSKSLARICFPVPEHLPNEDTWLDICVSHLSGIQIIHSDIIGCIWRMHENNSINTFEEYNIYSSKINVRHNALPFFINMHKEIISNESRTRIEKKIEIEKARFSGRMLDILLVSDIPMSYKLRAISSSNKIMYRARRLFFKLFSGW